MTLFGKIMLTLIRGMSSKYVIQMCNKGGQHCSKMASMDCPPCQYKCLLKVISNKQLFLEFIYFVLGPVRVYTLPSQVKDLAIICIMSRICTEQIQAKSVERLKLLSEGVISRTSAHF